MRPRNLLLSYLASACVSACPSTAISPAGSGSPLELSPSTATRPTPIERPSLRSGARLLASGTALKGVSLDRDRLVWLQMEGVHGEGPTVTREMGMYVAKRPDLRRQFVEKRDELWYTASLGYDVYAISEGCSIWRYARASGPAERAYSMGGGCWPLVVDGDALMFGANSDGLALWRIVPNPMDWSRGSAVAFRGLSGIVQQVAVDPDYVYHVIELREKGRVYRLTKRPDRMWWDPSRPPEVIYEGTQFLHLANTTGHLLVSDQSHNAIIAIDKASWRPEVVASTSAPSEIGAARGGAVWAEESSGRIFYIHPTSRSLTVLVQHLIEPRLRAVDDDLIVWSSPSKTVESGDDLFAMPWP